MCRLHRNPERRTNVLPRHLVQFPGQCDVLACQPFHHLTELKRQHRDIEMPRRLHRPIRFTPRCRRVTHAGQSQLACGILQRTPRRLQCRIVELGQLRRTSRAPCHAHSLVAGSVLI
jgi:hypothetical protein